MIDIPKYNSKQKIALELLKSTVKKFIKFWGGSRSGKTWLVIRFIRVRCHIYPGSKHLVARYSFANAKKTIWLQTMYPEFKKDEDLGLCKILKAEGMVQYKNGSIVMLGGLEPARIDSVLASEYGTIFITEANENRYEYVETLFSRLNDTSKDANGNQIKLKFIIDLNPTVDRSWTNILFMRGLDPIDMTPKSNFHEFAELWFSPEDNRDNLAEGYIETLKGMSAAKRKRFYEGKYGSYQGLVFQIQEEIHIVDDFEIPQGWRRIRAIDFGFTHPFVCLWLAYDPKNDVAYVYREWVMTRQTVRYHAGKIKELSVLDLLDERRKSPEAWKDAEKMYSATVCDHDAEDRATLEENGIRTKKAVKEVLAGIDNVIDLLDCSNGRRPRIKIFRSCSHLTNGIYSYRWKDSGMGGKQARDREVVKEDDDECDALRYGINELFPIEKGFQFIAIGGDGAITRRDKAAETVSEVGNAFSKLLK